MTQTETVKNTGTHPVDLADGRPLAPGESAVNVDVDDAHNADLIEQGLVGIQGAHGGAGAKARTSEPHTSARTTADRNKED